jgi:hypothetical protein
MVINDVENYLQACCVELLDHLLELDDLLTQKAAT